MVYCSWCSYLIEHPLTQYDRLFICIFLWINASKEESHHIKISHSSGAGFGTQLSNGSFSVVAERQTWPCPCWRILTAKLCKAVQLGALLSVPTTIVHAELVGSNLWHHGLTSSSFLSKSKGVIKFYWKIEVVSVTVGGRTEFNKRNSRLVNKLLVEVWVTLSLPTLFESFAFLKELFISDCILQLP